MTVFIAKIEKGEIVFPSVYNKARYHDWLLKSEGKSVKIEDIKSRRSDQQNRALHLWLTMLATELNAAGYTVQAVLKQKIDVDWDMEKCKELLWRPAQEAILGKKSTRDLSKLEDIDKVYDHLCRHLGEKFGLQVPEFPRATLDGKIIGKNYTI